MAQKRMFDKTITNSDDFLEMPMSSQVLYFHLSMNADDDGFINNWKSIMRMTGTKEDDLKVLIAKQFIIPFDSGVIVIKHWRINNFLRKDRHVETTHKEELAMLEINDKQEYAWLTNGQPRIDKNSIDKNSIKEKEINKEKEKYGEFKNVLLTKEEYAKLEKSNLLPYIETLSSYMASRNKRYKSHYATILNWSRREPKKEQDVPKWFNQDIKEREIDDETRRLIEEIEGTSTHSN